MDIGEFWKLSAHDMELQIAKDILPVYERMLERYHQGQTLDDVLEMVGDLPPSPGTEALRLIIRQAWDTYQLVTEQCENFPVYIARLMEDK